MSPEPEILPASFAAIHDDMHRRAPSSEALRGAVLAMGNFEGVHRGHQHVLARARALAQASGAPSGALTFEPHPRAYFNPGHPVFRLTDVVAKLRLLAANDLSGAVVMAFNEALASLSAEEFIAKILVGRYGVRGVVVGFDFHFGKGRGGSPEVLAQAGRAHKFAVEVVPAFLHRGERVSSGLIRNALAEGNAERAHDLLGFPWFVSGEVVHGEARGRELGYPTANLVLDPGCELRHGIYAVRVGVGGRRYEAVASFGRRPTFDNGSPLLEVFLFDFSGDLYGQGLDVAFVGWIRPELKFDGVAALVAQMDRDSAAAKQVLVASAGAFPPI